MIDDWKEYQAVLKHMFNSGLDAVKLKILELRPGTGSLSSYFEGKQDLCDILLDFIEKERKHL